MTLTVPLCATIVFAACQSSKPAPTKADSVPVAVVRDAALPDVAFGAPVLVTPIDPAARAAQHLAALTPADATAARAYAKLLGAVADCKPTSFGDFDADCAAYKPVAEERSKHYEDAAWISIERAGMWLQAETRSAMVRKVIARRAADENGDPDLLAVLLANETDRFELERLVSMAYNGTTASSPALVQALIARGTFPDQGVRRMAMWALGRMSPRPSGVNEALLKTIDSDPDSYVRQETCKASGFVADGAMLAAYERLLVPTADPALYDACLSGLMWMWWPGQNSSRVAYERTITLITHGRHDTQMTAAWGELESFGDNLDREDAPRKLWVKLPELRAALTAFITDANANRIGRGGAIVALAGLRPSKQELQALRSKVADDDWLVGCVDAELAGHSCRRSVEEAAHEEWKRARGER